LVVVEFGREVPPRSFVKVLPFDMELLEAAHVRLDPLCHPDIPLTVCGIDTQVRYWADQMGKPAAVLGYCTGLGFAAELAARIGDAETPLIVFDPVLPTFDDAQSLLIGLAIGIDEELDPSTVPDLAGVPTPDAVGLVGHFLRSVVQRCATDIPADLVDTLTEQQRIWVSYTLAAVSFGAGPRTPDHVFLSADAEWPAGPSTSVHRFPTDALGLFHSPDVVDALAKILAGVVTGGEA
jgi:hypothetical protein